MYLFHSGFPSAAPAAPVHMGADKNVLSLTVTRCTFVHKHVPTGKVAAQPNYIIHDYVSGVRPFERRVLLHQRKLFFPFFIFFFFFFFQMNLYAPRKFRSVCVSETATSQIFFNLGPFILSFSLLPPLSAFYNDKIIGYSIFFITVLW